MMFRASSTFPLVLALALALMAIVASAARGTCSPTKDCLTGCARPHRNATCRTDGVWTLLLATVSAEDLSRIECPLEIVGNLTITSSSNLSLGNCSHITLSRNTDCLVAHGSLIVATSSYVVAKDTSYTVVNTTCREGAFKAVTASPPPTRSSRLCYELDYEEGGVVLSYKLVCGMAEEASITPYIAMGVAGGALLIAVIVVLALVGRKMYRAKRGKQTSMWMPDGETVLVKDDQI